MRKAILISGLLLFVLGILFGFWGVHHEIAKIPPAVLAERGDTDWIGTEWTFRGLFISAVGLLLVSGVVIEWLVRTVRKNLVRRLEEV